MQQQEVQNRVSELDGIRGLAILIVFFYHLIVFASGLANSHVLRSPLVKLVDIGWIGVDIFFVLSGFLITAILLKTRGETHYFRNFYARRVLRIFPLYYLVAVVVYIFLPFILVKGEILAVVQTSWPFSMLYLQNWLYIPKVSHYFDAGTPAFLGPTWSLAIEEQFYLIWPTVVYFFDRRKLFILSVMILVFAFLTRVFLFFFARSWVSLEEFIHFSTVTRFDGFCVGALIALAFESEEWKQKISRFGWPILLCSLAGWIGITIATNNNLSVLAKNPYKNIWSYLLLALGSGALVVLALTQQPQSRIRIFFRNPILVFWGKYSYAIYILHIPIILILLKIMRDLGYRGDIAWFVFIVLGCTLTILCSLTTWHLLEKHVLKLKKYFASESEKAGG